MEDILIYGAWGVFALIAAANMLTVLRRLAQGEHERARVSISITRERTYQQGYADGERAALKKIIVDETKDPNYRTAAAKVAKACAECGRMCIHCAKDGSRT